MQEASRSSALVPGRIYKMQMQTHPLSREALITHNSDAVRVDNLQQSTFLPQAAAAF